MKKIEIIPVIGLPLIKKGDDLAKLIVKSLSKQGVKIRDYDVIIIAHKLVSKAEGYVVNLNEVKPSKKAIEIAKKTNKDARCIELALQNSREVLIEKGSHLITITKHGFIYPFSGIDLSNSTSLNDAVLLPKNPDRSAREIRKKIYEITGKKIAVIISDTTGRPFRKGSINIAVGVSGIKPLADYRKTKDINEMNLKYKLVALADELASAAELVMGQGKELIGAALIRGLREFKRTCIFKGKGGKDLIRRKDLLVSEVRRHAP